ncbi:MAG TPA: hypothetical protein VEQ58_11555, partial [Polyangiaceae bacterium]|nr:hypothetical protein [Polyangiaceae bacterium]
FLAFGEPLQLLAFGLLVLLVVNAKFTAAIYAVLLVVALLGCALLAAAPRARVQRLALLSAGALALGVLVIGYAPYVTNSLRHGHPFYPLFGHGALDVVTEQTPVSWRDDAPLLRLVQSLLSRPQSWILPAPRLTPPFVFAPGDLKAFGDPDTRVAGFGPLFSAGLLGAIAIAALSVARSRQTRSYVVFMSLVAASVLVNPEAWWARWAPQLWLAAALAPPLLLEDAVRWRRLLGFGVAGVLAANSLLLAGIALRKALKGSAVWRQTLGQLSAARESCGPFYVVWGDHTSNRARLERAGIPFVEAASQKAVACSQWEPILPAGNERLTTVSLCSPRAPLDSCLGPR